MQEIGRAAKIIPDLYDGALESFSVAKYPYPADAHPIVGWLNQGKVYVAVTHSGATLGPLLGRLICEELLGREQSHLKPYRPDRNFSNQQHLYWANFVNQKMMNWHCSRCLPATSARKTILFNTLFADWGHHEIDHQRGFSLPIAAYTIVKCNLFTVVERDTRAIPGCSTCRQSTVYQNVITRSLAWSVDFQSAEGWQTLQNLAYCHWVCRLRLIDAWLTLSSHTILRTTGQQQAVGFPYCPE